MKKLLFIILLIFGTVFQGFAADVPVTDVPETAAAVILETETDAGVFAPELENEQENALTKSAADNKENKDNKDNKPLLLSQKDVTSKLITFMPSGNLAVELTVLSILILLSACASKFSSWINMPCLLIFLGMGMLFGENGVGEIPFSDSQLANTIGSFAMVYILFSGGFSTNWKAVKKIAITGGILSSLGVLLTAGIMGFCIYAGRIWIFGESKTLSLSWCLLLGSVISSTDAAAVFSILRSRRVSLQDNLQALIEFESGSNDPMAAFLTIFMTAVVVMETKYGITLGLSTYKMIAPLFIQKMLLGVVLGITWGWLMVKLFNRIQLEYDGLYYVLGTGAVLLSYGATEMLQGNGFMSVYITGIFMGNSKFIYHNGVNRFSNGIAWLMQVLLFSMLGLLVTPHELVKIGIQGLVAAFILMVIARPIAVFLCMIASKFNIREKILVSWVGLRGGAPIMLATFPLLSGVPHSNDLFNVVFFVVLTSVLLQGMSIMPVAKMLHLDKPFTVHPRVPLEFDDTGNLDGETREFELMPGSRLIGKKLSEAGIPRGALVLLIRRNGRFLIPRGDMLLQVNDGLLVLAEVKELDETGVCLAS